VRLASGRLPAEGAFEVAIAADFAGAREMRLGEEIVFTTPTGLVPFTLVGLLDDAYALASTNGGRIGITHLTDLQAANGLADRASHLELALRSGADIGVVRERLQATASVTPTRSPTPPASATRPRASCRRCRRAC
jgi:hypothetical protein